jgi:hypothetical protein
MNLTFLAKRMAELKIDSDELARRCCVTKPHMRNIVNRGYIPSDALLKLLTYELGCTLHDLVPHQYPPSSKASA